MKTSRKCEHFVFENHPGPRMRGLRLLPNDFFTFPRIPGQDNVRGGGLVGWILKFRTSPAGHGGAEGYCAHKPCTIVPLNAHHQLKVENYTNLKNIMKIPGFKKA